MATVCYILLTSPSQLQSIVSNAAVSEETRGTGAVLPGSSANDAGSATLRGAPKRVWKPYNDYDRNYYEAHKRRPTFAEAKQWYADHKEEFLQYNSEIPTWQELKTHRTRFRVDTAKIREYTNKKRAEKRAEAKHKTQSVSVVEDTGPQIAGVSVSGQTRRKGSHQTVKQEVLLSSSSEDSVSEPLVVQADVQTYGSQAWTLVAAPPQQLSNMTTGLQQKFVLNVPAGMRATLGETSLWLPPNCQPVYLG